MIVSTFEYDHRNIYDSEFQEMVDLFDKKFPMADIESYENITGNYVIEIRGERITPIEMNWIIKIIGIEDLVSFTVNCKV